SIPFIFLSARSDPADLLKGRSLGVEDYLTKPIRREELVTTIRSRLSRFNQAQMAMVRQAYLDSLVTLAGAIEQRAPGEPDHIQRATRLALLLAARLGWAEHRLEMLRFAAILHDIGKIHISAATLFKTTPLTADEWAVIRRHPVTGAEMIKDVPFLTGCISYVRHHHEQWQGGGYPDGLAGEAIPDGARILAVVDAFDRICSPRVYAAARPADQALDELRALAGRRYDPAVVEALYAAWQAGEVQAIYPTPPA
ncbi:MAG: HD-GYP domain-containing protein, partial [Chloroflexota bacterium]